MSESILDECEKYQSIDKSNMINYSINSTKYYGEAADLAESIKIDFPKPENQLWLAWAAQQSEATCSKTGQKTESTFQSKSAANTSFQHMQTKKRLF